METHSDDTCGSSNARRMRDTIDGREKTGGNDMMNSDFKRGLYTGMGVLVAVYVFGLATGILKRVF